MSGTPTTSTAAAGAAAEHVVLNPSTGQPVSTVPLATVEQTDAAIATAQAV